MLDFLNKIFSNPFISTTFSGFGTSISAKLLKNKKTKIKHNINYQLQSDIDDIIKVIRHPSSFNQEEVFTHYFYKYKNRLSTDDVELLKNKLSENNPNYKLLLNALLGLIESIN